MNRIGRANIIPAVNSAAGGFRTIIEGRCAVGNGANVTRAGKNVRMVLAAENSHLLTSVKFVIIASSFGWQPSGIINEVGPESSAAKTDTTRPRRMAIVMSPRKSIRMFVIAEFVQDEEVEA